MSSVPDPATQARAEGAWLHDTEPLYVTLARLYPTERDARRVLRGAGARVEAVNFEGTALNLWFGAVEECARQSCLGALVEIARMEYPGAFDVVRERGWGPPLDQVVPLIVLREKERKREPQVTPYASSAPLEDIVRVDWREGVCTDAYLLAVLPVPPDAAALDSWARRFRSWQGQTGNTDWCRLLHLGDPCDPALKTAAAKRNIELLSVAEYSDRLIDLRGYVKQLTETLSTTAEYLPRMYIEQRAVLQVGKDAEVPDALAEVRRAIDEPSRKLVVVLGDFGTGKTFLLRKLAHQLGNEIQAGSSEVPIPLLMEMRDLHKSSSLDELLAQHLVRSKVERLNIPALRHMIRQGRVVLLFDGFDELALRLTYDRAAQHLDTVLEAIEERARVVLTSRVQHFRNDAQLRTALSKKLDQVAHRTWRLEKFDAGQIRRFFANTLGKASEALTS